MTDFVPPKKNDANGLIFYLGLLDMSVPGSYKSNPTLAAGDVKISKDGGATANLGTLPAVTPASSVFVKVTLSQSEMNCDNVAISFIDQTSPKEWCDVIIGFQTATRQLQDMAYPATTGRSMVVDAAGLVDANAVKVGPTGSGTAQTARDLGTSVLISSGTGTGQLDVTSGVIKANLVQILATALTETAGLLAGGFKKFFNIASPTLTTGGIDQTGDNFARAGASQISKTGNAICRGTVNTGASSTSVPTSAFTPAGAVADQFKDRVILFDADTTTTTLRGVAKAITASSNSATPTLTVNALPATPASGDTFSVI